MLNEQQTLMDTKIEETVLRYETKVLPVLYELDRMNARIAYDMMRCRISDDITERFNTAWDALKRLIHEIEPRGNNDDKETNQLEAQGIDGGTQTGTNPD